MIGFGYAKPHCSHSIILWSTHEKRPSDRDLLNGPMVCACAVRHHYTLIYDLRAVDATHIVAMVIGHFGHFEVLVAFVGAIGNPPIVLPIADTVFAANIDAMIVRFENHVFGSNLGPDHVVEQTVVEEISLKRSHAREILLLPLLQKSAALFIRHGLPIVGHKQHPCLIILSKLILASATALPAKLTVRGVSPPHDCTGLRHTIHFRMCYLSTRVHGRQRSKIVEEKLLAQRGKFMAVDTPSGTTLTADELEARRRAIDSAIGSFRIENMELDPEVRDAAEAYARGEISRAEMDARIDAFTANL